MENWNTSKIIIVVGIAILILTVGGFYIDQLTHSQSTANTNPNPPDSIMWAAFYTVNQKLSTSPCTDNQTRKLEGKWEYGYFPTEEDIIEIIPLNNGPLEGDSNVIVSETLNEILFISPLENNY